MQPVPTDTVPATQIKDRIQGLSRKVIALGLAVLVVVALWSAGWFWGAGEIRRQIGLLAAADGETAPQVTCGTVNVSGFPFRFDIECADLGILDQDRSVSLAGLRATVMVYNPTHVVFSAKGPARFDNALTGSESRLDFTGFEGSARVVTSDLIKGLGGVGWRIGRVSLVAEGVEWNETVVEDLLQAKVGHAELHLMDMPEAHDVEGGTAGLALYASVTDATLPGLAVQNGKASLEAELSQVPDDLMALADPSLLTRWVSRSGSFKLVRFAGDQPSPEESFDVSGEARLGPDGLINGNVSYRTKGVLDRFAAMLGPLQLAALKGKPEDDGSFSNTLSIVSGEVKLGGVSLGFIGPAF